MRATTRPLQSCALTQDARRGRCFGNLACSRHLMTTLSTKECASAIGKNFPWWLMRWRDGTSPVRGGARAIFRPSCSICIRRLNAPEAGRRERLRARDTQNVAPSGLRGGYTEQMAQVTRREVDYSRAKRVRGERSPSNISMRAGRRNLVPRLRPTRTTHYSSILTCFPRFA